MHRKSCIVKSLQLEIRVVHAADRVQAIEIQAIEVQFIEVQFIESWSNTLSSTARGPGCDASKPGLHSSNALTAMQFGDPASRAPMVARYRPFKSTEPVLHMAIVIGGR